MKVKFTKDVTFIPAWRHNSDLPKDEQFSVTLRVLEFNDLLLLLEKFNSKNEDGTLDIRAIASASSELLPRYTTLHNLKDEDGIPLEPGQIISHPVFMDLASELLTKLAEISTPTKDDEKN
jgi:hypothetical protein